MSDNVIVHDTVRLLDIELIDVQAELHRFVEDVFVVGAHLDDLASDLDVRFNSIRKVKVTGSSVAILGTVVTACGFAVSFFTFGASLPLAVAGSMATGCGGVTQTVSAVADFISTRATSTGAKDKLDEHNRRLRCAHDKCRTIGLKLNQVGTVELDFPHWLRFWIDLVYGTGIGTGFLRMARARPVGEEFGIATWLPNLLPRSYTGTLAQGILGVTIDLHTLIESSMDIRRRNAHVVSRRIRGLAQKLREQCPTREDVDQMIENTLQSLHALNTV